MAWTSVVWAAACSADPRVYAPPVQSLIDELGRLPGVGPKSAQRIAFHLLKLSKDDARYFEKQRKAYGESGSAEDGQHDDGQRHRVRHLRPRRAEPAGEAPFLDPDLHAPAAAAPAIPST